MGLFPSRAFSMHCRALVNAIRYGLSWQEAFSLFLTDGRMAIANNPAERALRPIGLGRKNWLFAGPDTGAETLARAMTVIETAKLNDLDPQAYLADILDRPGLGTTPSRS